MNGAANFPEGSVDFSVMEVSQPLGSFYVGKMSAADLQAIAAADTRRKVDREVETYTGIQRELSTKRQKEIRAYISTYDAAFPNTFIIAVKSEDIAELINGVLRIRRNEKVASIIDGQHRLSGFTELNRANFELIVAVFVDLPIEDQAMLFATINLKQTKVNPSLVFDLFEETTRRSPQKTAHNIAKGLNQETDSPFYHRIKPLGKKTDEYIGRLTQATFVKQLLPLICKDPDRIRDLIKRRQALDPNDPENTACIFWRYFCEEKDWAILKVVKNYFAAVASVFPEDWKSEESPLSKTIGYSALMRLLPELFQRGLAKAPPSLEESFFREEFLKAQGLAPFTFLQYPASGAGQAALYNALREAIGLL